MELDDRQEINNFSCDSHSKSDCYSRRCTDCH